MYVFLRETVPNLNSPDVERVSPDEAFPRLEVDDSSTPCSGPSSHDQDVETRKTMDESEALSLGHGMRCR